MHLLLALAIVAVWGTNFVVIRIGLDHFAPLQFAALRFGFAALPWAFLVRRPQVSWRALAAYGLLIGVGQFGLLFLAMRADISPGLASLVIQMQAFFTVALAAGLLRERVRSYQWAALAVAAAGLGLIALEGHGSATPKGLTLVLLGALSWAGSNLIVKRAGRVNMLAFVVWSSLFAAPPLLLLSFVAEGPAAFLTGLKSANLVAWAAVLWQSAGNTLFGFGAWSWLLARHPAAAVAPMSLLVPVFGMAASALLLSEPMPPWKLIATGLILAGLALNVAWPLLARRRSTKPKAARLKP